MSTHSQEVYTLAHTHTHGFQTYKKNITFATFPHKCSIARKSVAAHSQDVCLQQTHVPETKQPPMCTYEMNIWNGPCGMWCIRKTGLTSTEAQWKSMKHYGRNSPLQRLNTMVFLFFLSNKAHRPQFKLEQHENTQDTLLNVRVNINCGQSSCLKWNYLHLKDFYVTMMHSLQLKRDPDSLQCCWIAPSRTEERHPRKATVADNISYINNYRCGAESQHVHSQPDHTCTLPQLGGNFQHNCTKVPYRKCSLLTATVYSLHGYVYTGHF